VATGDIGDTGDSVVSLVRPRLGQVHNLLRAPTMRPTLALVGARGNVGTTAVPRCRPALPTNFS
jgi:hypothetical protein